MLHPIRRSAWHFFALVLGLTLAASAPADEPKAAAKEAKGTPLPTGQLGQKDWLQYPTTRLKAGEIDELVGANLKKATLAPTALTTDEQFIRRATLDLTGGLPMPADVTEFLADKSPDKRAKLVDKLLASDEFARHWTLYFRDVIVSRTTDFRLRQSIGHFERWLRAQLKDNKSWGAITRDLLTATGDIKQDEPDKNGQAFFMASRTGADSSVELAAETSRIFLGIQIQCAQCHDHPSDVWKRQQFHEFTAFFARVKERPIRDPDSMRFIGQTVASLPFGEHRMPDKDDPKTGKIMTPRFIDGKAPPGAGKIVAGNGPIGGKFPPKFGPKGGPFGGKGGGGMGDLERRKALADMIVSKDNPWFAGAFVNRIWGELMGQSFYQPIDDMGPQKDAVMPEVLARVAASFRGNDYDIKNLFREIMASDVYQRQIRPGEHTDDHLLFAANNPTRMNANTLWQTLVGTLGSMSGGGFGGPKKKGPGGFGGGFGLENTFKQEFGFDPSSKSDEVEGSVAQALMLMNNPVINQKIRATGTNLLARIVQSHSQDEDALRTLYMRTLARRPSDREMARCKDHIRSAGSRADAYEDILWALINSTEYQTKR